MQAHTRTPELRQRMAGMPSPLLRRDFLEEAPGYMQCALAQLQHADPDEDRNAPMPGFVVDAAAYLAWLPAYLA